MTEMNVHVNPKGSIVVNDGHDTEEYISVKKIIDACVSVCIRYVDDKSPVVYEDERYKVEAFEELFRDVLGSNDYGYGQRFYNKFVEAYIQKRFIDRQMELL